MASGMEMMLKSFGVDPKKLVEDFTLMKEGVINTLKEISERNARIETYMRILGERQELIWKAMNQPAPLPMLPNTQPAAPQPQPAQPMQQLQNPQQPH